MKAIDQWSLTALEPSLGLGVCRPAHVQARAGQLIDPLSNCAGRLIDPLSDSARPRTVLNQADRLTIGL